MRAGPNFAVSPSRFHGSRMSLRDDRLNPPRPQSAASSVPPVAAIAANSVSAAPMNVGASAAAVNAGGDAALNAGALAAGSVVDVAALPTAAGFEVSDHFRFANEVVLASRSLCARVQDARPAWRVHQVDTARYAVGDEIDRYPDLFGVGNAEADDLRDLVRQRQGILQGLHSQQQAYDAALTRTIQELVRLESQISDLPNQIYHREYHQFRAVSASAELPPPRR